MALGTLGTTRETKSWKNIHFFWMKMYCLGNIIEEYSERGSSWSVQWYSYSSCEFYLSHCLSTLCVLGFLLVAKEYLVSFIKYLICTTIFLSRDVIHDVTWYHRLNSSYCLKWAFRLITEWPSSTVNLTAYSYSSDETDPEAYLAYSDWSTKG